MATPINKIEFGDLAPTLHILAKVGFKTAHADWMRGGLNESNARWLLTAIKERMEAEATQKRDAEEARRFRIIDSGYTGDYATERCQGPYWTYPAEWKPKSAMERAKILAPHFPGVDFSHVEALAERYYVNVPASESSEADFHGFRDKSMIERRLVLPEHADGGLIVFPKLEAVATKCVKRPKKSWQPLNVAVGYILGVLKELYPNFEDMTESKVGPKYERLLDATANYLTKLDAETPGDVLVVPFQAGELFVGYSVRSSRSHMVALKRHVPAHEFANLCLMASDEERFVDGTIIPLCPGTERAPFADNSFTCAPYVKFHNGERWFYAGHYGTPDRKYGSTSFVLPSE